MSGSPPSCATLCTCCSSRSSLLTSAAPPFLSLLVSLPRSHTHTPLPTHTKPPPLPSSHGKSCPRCAASKKTSRPSLGPCPLVGLSDSSKGAKSPRRKGVKKEEDGEESEAEESDLTEEEGDEAGEGVKKVVTEEKEEGVKAEEETGEGANGEVAGGEKTGEGVVTEQFKAQQQLDIEEAVRVAHGG